MFVRRDRIRLRPKSFYQNALRYFQTDESYVDVFPWQFRGAATGGSRSARRSPLSDSIIIPDGRRKALKKELRGKPPFVPEISVRARHPCQNAMYLWHAIFGEELIQARRQHDPRIPLFLKLSNMEREIFDESQSNVDNAETVFRAKKS